MTEGRTRGADANTGDAQAGMRDVAAALAVAPSPAVPDDARQHEGDPGTAYLRGFTQAMRDLWSSVAGTASTPGEAWDPHDQDWRDGLADCQDFYAAHGHLDVPAKANGIRIRRLRTWVSRRQADYEAGILTADQITALEACGMQWQGPRTRNRQQMVTALRTFHSEHGHANVPVTYVTAEGLKLGQWFAAKKQTARRGGQLHPETAAALRRCGVAWAGSDPVGPPAGHDQSQAPHKDD